MADFLFDVRDALRGFRRDRLYAAAVIGTLALTLGATTAIFSIVNGVLLEPLAYRDANRLVSIREIVPEIADRYPTLPVSPRHFDEWRNRATSFVAMAELDWRTSNLTGAGDPAQITVLRASGTLFDVLQSPVAVGRPLTLDDERPGRPDVAVVSDALWRERLGHDAAVVGRGITLGGKQYAVVGVLPPGYELPSFDVLGNTGTLTAKVDAIVPMRLDLTKYDWMGEFNFPVVARLEPGVTIEQARAEMDVVQGAVAAIAEREAHERVALRATVTPLGDAIVGHARRGLLLLLGAVLAVVLIACSNLANLSLTRALARGRDGAVRAALGASRARLMRHVLVEQLLLAAAGGAAGLLVAREALELFVRTAPVDLPRVSDVVIDGRVLAFAAALAIGAGIAVALLPASRVGLRDVHGLLRSGGHGATDRGGVRTRAVLLAVQVALSVTLLVVTGLLVTSFVRLLRVDPGFSADGVVSVDIAPIAARYPDAKARAALYDRILDRTRTLPGVATAAFTSALPLTGETWVDVVQYPDGAKTFAAKPPSANYRFVAPGYFRALSIPILKGRSIEERDRSGDAVAAVISARTAETLWPGRDPIDHQFSRGDPKQKYRVVGVVADGHTTRLDAPSPLMVFVPYWFNNEGKSVLVVRTKGDAAAAVAAIRRAIRDVDPEIAVAEASPLQHVVDAALAGPRYEMWLFVAFGLVALLIATVGVYATTAYAVSRRQRELNIRMALGARVSQVFGLVVGQTTVPLVAGLAAGCAGAAAIGTAVASLLFEVPARDPFVMAAVAALVGAVGVLATAAAAKRALLVDPASALRAE